MYYSNNINNANKNIIYTLFLDVGPGALPPPPLPTYYDEDL